jgi:hemoglobin/transferrin/lactoferrin receptor protein
MRRVLCLASASLVFSISLFSTAMAEEQQTISSVKKVTVYATRSPQSSFDVPVMTSIIDTDAAGNATASDIGGLLEHVTSVEVDNGPRRNGQTISIRGFDSEAIITMIDNRRQNFESAHDGRFFIDPSLLKSINVVKGASSAIYGGGAIGGVVAFETKDAADLLAPGESKGALTAFNYRSATDDYAPSASAYTRSGNWDLLGNLTYRHSDDIKQGDGNELEAKDHVLSGLFKAGYTLNDLHTLNFQYQVSRNDGKEPNNGAGAITASNPILNKEVRDNQLSFKYAYDNPDNVWLSPKLHFYYNDTGVEEADISGTNNGRVQTRDLETFGFTLDNQSKLSGNDNFKQILSYGFEFYTDEQSGSSTSTADGTRGGVPNAEADNYGFYLQDEINLESNIGQFFVIPAIRYDHYESNDVVGNSQSEGEFSPKISTSYKPTKNLLIFGSWAQAFRAPNLTELYPSGQHFPGGFPIAFHPIFGFPTAFAPNNNFVSNPNLLPETVTTFEIGAGINFDGVFSNNDHIEIKGAWHKSDGDDFITQEVNIAAGTTRNLNIANAELTGWEIDGEYQVNGFKAKLGLSHVTAKNDDTGEFLSNSVPHTLITDISYNFNKSNGTIGWRTRMAEENDELPETEISTKGYSVHNLYYRWQNKDEGKEKLVIDLGIDNVTDKAYSRRFSGLYEEGRSYVARVAYQW